MTHTGSSWLAQCRHLFTMRGFTGLRLLDFLIPSSGYTVHKNIVYGNDSRQKLDVYVPDKPAAGNPVMVFFYGGSWQTGSKDDYRFVARSLALKGYYTVLVNYRLYPQAYFPDFLVDGASAVHWTHTHITEFGGNPQNLFLSGHSSGAYIAVMLALNETYLEEAGGKVEWIKGVIGIAGPYDFLPFTDPTIKALFSKAADDVTQPINHVRAKTSPLLLLTGDADIEVLPRNTEHLTAKLKQFGANVETRIYPGVGHRGIILAIANGFHFRAPTLADIDAFVTTYTAQ